MSLLKALDLPPVNRGGPAANGADAKGADAKGGDAKGAALGKAADAWRGVVDEAAKRIAALQKTVRAACAGEPAAFVKAAEQGLATLDGALGPVDAGLADALARAVDPAARDAALADARQRFEACTAHLKGATLIAHIDRQPFGATTGIKALIVEGLGGVAKAMR